MNPRTDPLLDELVDARVFTVLREVLANSETGAVPNNICKVTGFASEEVRKSLRRLDQHEAIQIEGMRNGNGDLHVITGVRGALPVPEHVQAFQRPWSANSAAVLDQRVLRAVGTGNCDDETDLPSHVREQGNAVLDSAERLAAIGLIIVDTYGGLRMTTDGAALLQGWAKATSGARTRACLNALFDWLYELDGDHTEGTHLFLQDPRSWFFGLQFEFSAEVFEAANTLYDREFVTGNQCDGMIRDAKITTKGRQHHVANNGDASAPETSAGTTVHNNLSVTNSTVGAIAQGSQNVQQNVRIDQLTTEILDFADLFEGLLPSLKLSAVNEADALVRLAEVREIARSPAPEKTGIAVRIRKLRDLAMTSAAAAVGNVAVTHADALLGQIPGLF